MPTNPNVRSDRTIASAAQSPRIRRSLKVLLVGLTSAALALGFGVAPALATGTATVTVHVTDEDGGGPLEGVKVTMWAPTAGAPVHDLTDAGGDITFTELIGETYRYNAELTGYMTETTSLVVEEGGTYSTSIDIGVATAAVHGTVTVTGGGPLGNAHVSVSKGEFDAMFGSTTESGEFAIPNLSAGHYRLTLYKEGFETRYLETDLALGQNRLVDASLDKILEGTVSGKVTNASHVALEGITVKILRLDGVNLVTGGVVTSAADGTFTIEDVPAATGYTIEFSQEGGPYETQYLGNKRTFSSATKFAVADEQVVTGKDISLPFGGKVSGHVNLATPDGHVDYEPGGWPGPTLFTAIGGVWTPLDVPSPFAGAGGKGDFTFAGLPPGTYRLGFIDTLTGPRAFTTKYWKSGSTTGVTSIASATSFTVSGGKTSTGRNITLALPKPAFDPAPVDESALADYLEDGINAAGPVTQGDNVVIEVGDWRAGEWVSAWVHSDPKPMTDGWVQVDSHGRVTATVDYDVPAGSHDLVVQFADGNVAGWTAFEVAATSIAHKVFAKVAKPTITGSVKNGATLTAKPGTSKPTPARYSYQWKVGGVDVDGATQKTYVPTIDDIGKKIQVTITGSKLGVDSSTSTSALTAAVGLGTLATGTPVVTGSRKVGVTLFATPGSWPPGTDLTYQWLRNGVAIPGKTDDWYQQSASDYKKVVTVKVRGTLAGYVPASKNSSSSVSKTGLGTFALPVSVAVSSDPKVGTPATPAIAGGFSPTPTKLSYQWYLGTKAISGATKSSYTPTSGTVGHTLKVKITASRSGYTSRSVVSAVSDPVVSGTFAVPGTITLAPARVGTTSTAPAVSWGTAPTSTSYAWYVGAVKVATTSTYKPVAADVGKDLTVTITAKRAGFVTGVVTSEPTVVLVGLFSAKPMPTISGTLRPHQTLTASAGSWSPSGATFTYQWYSGGDLIAGATSKTYVVSPFDVDRHLWVSVTGLKAGYELSPQYSDATGFVDALVYANCAALRADYPNGVFAPGTEGDGAAWETQLVINANWVALSVPGKSVLCGNPLPPA